MKKIPHVTGAEQGRFGGARGGFSLVELLVVIAIIGILAAASSSALGGGMRGRGVAGAVNVASSLALSARMEAVKRVGGGVGGALLVVDSTAGTNKGALQRLVVMRNVSTNIGAKSWQMAGPPVALPQGVFFSTKYSQGTGTTNFDFSNRSGSQTGGETGCFFYEFDERGRFFTPDQVTPGAGEAQLVFVAGVLGADGSFAGTNWEASRDGILLRKAGRATYFQNADQIKQPGT